MYQSKLAGADLQSVPKFYQVAYQKEMKHCTKTLCQHYLMVMVLLGAFSCRFSNEPEVENADMAENDTLHMLYGEKGKYWIEASKRQTGFYIDPKGKLVQLQKNSKCFNIYDHGDLKGGDVISWQLIGSHLVDTFKEYPMLDFNLTSLSDQKLTVTKGRTSHIYTYVSVDRIHWCDPLFNVRAFIDG
ncbi:MAG: hypothetical protein KDD36_09005 [Flavobacteriales bacterium]|nr:hypothetical protein [Flavobacteriales bacterium]